MTQNERRKRGTEGQRRRLVYCPGYLDRHNQWNTGYFCPARTLKGTERISDCCLGDGGQTEGRGTPCSCCCRSFSEEVSPENLFPIVSEPKVRRNISSSTYDDIWNWNSLADGQQNNPSIIDSNEKYRSFAACVLSFGIVPLLLLFCFFIFAILYHIKYRRDKVTNQSNNNLFIIQTPQSADNRDSNSSECTMDLISGLKATNEESKPALLSFCSAIYSRGFFPVKRPYDKIQDKESCGDLTQKLTGSSNASGAQCNCRYIWLYKYSTAKLWKKIYLSMKNVIRHIPGISVKKGNEAESV